MANPLKNTRWTYVIAGRSPDDTRYEEAWRYLFDTYRNVILSYFRRHASDQSTATEWTDEFMAGWVEGKLGGADQNKGQFRQFLFGALRNFRYKKYRQAASRAGSPEGAHTALHENIPDHDAPESEAAFARDYANMVLNNALCRLKEYQEERHRKGATTRHYTLLTEYHIVPSSREDQPTYQQLADRYDMTQKAVERQLDQARHKLRDWILAELRETVTSQEDLQEEVYLLLEHCRGALEGCF